MYSKSTTDMERQSGKLLLEFPNYKDRIYFIHYFNYLLLHRSTTQSLYFVGEFGLLNLEKQRLATGTAGCNK